MDTTSGLIHPGTFIDGGMYLWREKWGTANSNRLVPVRFIRYDSCPAIVVVADERGEYQRCLREDLFLPAQ